MKARNAAQPSSAQRRDKRPRDPKMEQMLALPLGRTQQSLAFQKVPGVGTGVGPDAALPGRICSTKTC